jgi:hypothetical protein
MARYPDCEELYFLMWRFVRLIEVEETSVPEQVGMLGGAIQRLPAEMQQVFLAAQVALSDCYTVGPTTTHDPNVHWKRTKAARRALEVVRDTIVTYELRAH